MKRILLGLVTVLAIGIGVLAVAMSRKAACPSGPPPALADGATPMQFFRRILVPMSRTPIAAMFVIQFIAGWNQYLWPLLITNNESMRTVQIGISLLQDQERFMYNNVMAGVVIVLIPTFLLFIVSNRQLIRGLTAGAVKG
jgi:sn-glycerol 3-phosphate transport system permease protein